MLNTVYGPDRFGLSFELFPPKTESGARALFQHVEQLTQFRPSYITCTYGAGGSTRDKTLDVVDRVKQQFQVPVASHLTCVGATREDLRGYLIEAQRRGVDAIVALRGDPPEGQEHFKPVPGGLRYANELVELIRGEFPQFSIAVAGYPETHQEALSPEADLDNLKRKVEAGADVVITQLFYQQDDFFRFRDRYDQAGIEAPLVPGILPVTNLAQIKRITALCGARLPDPFVQRLSEQEDPEWQFQVGVDFATEQVQALVDGGVPGVHFYVLNKSQATSQVLQRVELPPASDV
jgi:methylenetetrahydrofolate reductase (NADPH)